MQLAWSIAWRYLRGKKSTNAINVITWISVTGIAIGTAALIIILSVFNGFEDLLSSLFNSFNPDLKAIPIEGKTFEIEEEKIINIEKLEEVDLCSKTLEEIALFEYKGVQDFGTVKGVDEKFHLVIPIDSVIESGEFKLQKKGVNYAVLGAGLEAKLKVNVMDQFNSMSVYMPKRNSSALSQSPFKKKYIFPAGAFSIQSDFDNKYVLTPLSFSQDLLELSNKVSALEIKLNPDINPNLAKSKIAEIIGPAFQIKDRYEQDEAFLKIMHLEKWLGYVILCLAVILVAFNLVGCLWMIVLDKRKDIAVLRSMGASKKMVASIFKAEGMLVSLIGIAAGTILAIGFYILQKEYSIIGISDGFMIDAYPISLRLLDVIIVMTTVFIIGYLASIAPSIRAKRVSPQIRAE